MFEVGKYFIIKIFNKFEFLSEYSQNDAQLQSENMLFKIIDKFYFKGFNAVLTK